MSGPTVLSFERERFDPTDAQRTVVLTGPGELFVVDLFAAGCVDEWGCGDFDT